MPHTSVFRVFAIWFTALNFKSTDIRKAKSLTTTSFGQEDTHNSVENDCVTVLKGLHIISRTVYFEVQFSSKRIPCWFTSASPPFAGVPTRSATWSPINILHPETTWRENSVSTLLHHHIDSFNSYSYLCINSISMTLQIYARGITSNTRTANIGREFTFRLVVSGVKPTLQ